MVYADYDFYKEHYCGTLVSEAEFTHLSVRASAKIDFYINCELSEEEVTDEVRFAVCEVCDILHTSGAHDGIEYERNDGYWVSYEDRGGLGERIKSSVKTWLSGSGLLYRGRDFA